MESNKEIVVEENFNIGQRMDEIEATMCKNLDLLTLPLVHRFTDGLYIRELAIPQGTMITSKTHKTQHQFILLKGVISVWDNDGTEHILQAPHCGITEPNTRRIAYAWCDCLWSTIHANPENKSLEELELDLFEDYDNGLMDDEAKAKIKEAQELSEALSKTINPLIENKKREICQQQ
jgi:hypothetical protein